MSIKYEELNDKYILAEYFCLLDGFAAAALSGLCANSTEVSTPRGRAKSAYAIAHSMMAERKRARDAVQSCGISRLERPSC